MRAKAIFLLTCVFALCVALMAPAADAPPTSRDGVFIHITAGRADAHRVLMALNMAVLMSADHDVLVYFDIKGIEVVLKDSEDMKYAQFPPLKTQLAALREKGVCVMACPGCLKAAGKTPADLAPGVQVAEKDKFFSFTKGRILTLDY
jgi:predicted peroxiredoxin